jgi:hypothetical protein
MSTEATTANSAGSDPLKAVADAMQTAVDAAKDGVADARASAEQMAPAVGRFFSRFVYTTSYTISYGLVFPTMFLVSAVPKDNALVHGLVDGGRAARKKVHEIKSRSHAEEPLEEADAATAEESEAHEDAGGETGSRPKSTKKPASGKKGHANKRAHESEPHGSTEADHPSGS